MRKFKYVLNNKSAIKKGDCCIKQKVWVIKILTF